MINIAFFINGAKPPRGGEFATFNFIKNLNKAKFHPIVIYAEEGLIIKKIKQLGIDTLRIPLRKEITSFNIKEVLYNPVRLFSFIRHLLGSGYVFEVMRVLRKNNIDLIHAADHISKLVCGIAGKLLGIKLVSHCHDDFSGPYFQDNHSAVGKLLKLVNYIFVDKIIAVSEKSRRCFERNGKKSPKVTTIYCGVDVDIYDPCKVDNSLLHELGIRKDCIIIGSIGVLDRHKGQMYLIKAIEKLKINNIDNVLCIICGTGPEEENLKNYVRENYLANEIMFLGFRKDVIRVFKILDILTITSFHEAVSIVLLEALAMKVPVISTDVGGLGEVVEDGNTGLFVPPGDTNALYDALLHCIQDPEMRKQMGENGRKIILEKFTLEKGVRDTEKVYLEMMEGNNGY